MSNLDIVNEILEHHGVKGMKWGVRKQRLTTTGVLSEISGKPERHDDEVWRNRTIRNKVSDILYDFQPMAGFGWGGLNNKVSKATFKAMKPDIEKLNKKPEYNTRQARREIKAEAKGKIHKNKSGVVDQYYREHNRIFQKHVREQAPKFMETSPSGKWETKLYVSNKPGGPWSVYVTQADKAKHAADDIPDLAITGRPIFDDDGFIIDWEPVLIDMTQSAIDDVLAHFGTKGMKWGVRKDRAQRVSDMFLERGLAISTPGSRERGAARKAKLASTPVKVTEKGKKLKTSGGKGRSAHPDAVRARTLGQVGKKSGLKALSNEELQTYAQRLQLEQNVKRLNFNDMNPGKKFVATILGRSGNSLASEGVNTGTKKLGKRALKLAMA